jgi:hypothetical protein
MVVILGAGTSLGGLAQAPGWLPESETESSKDPRRLKS